MLKKIDTAKNFLSAHDALFCCPICNENVKQVNYSLICTNDHRFDLSKKGTLYFLKQQVHTEYNRKMLHHRGRMIQSGMYQPMLELLYDWLPKQQTVVDVGCGEGGFLNQLYTLGFTGTAIGFDLSKEGIYLASNHPVPVFWCVADLTHMPFSTSSIQTILNIFTPSHYQEFQRILTKDGELIKVIPESGYLQELRAAFYPNNLDKQVYSNQRVKEKFEQSMKLLEEKRITYSFEIPVENRLDLLEMSPLEWQVSEERKKYVQENPLEKITIDVLVLKGQKR